VFLPVFGYAQGVRFEQGLSLRELQQKAKAAHKYLFIDCYASWCGPCKLMEKTTYTDSAVAKIMNRDFISAKFQLDRTTRDSQDIRNRYADAGQIEQTYQVNAYPTFLFFDPDGKIVHRGVGYLAPQDFIHLAQTAENPPLQYYTLLASYKAGNLPSADKPALAMAAAALGEDQLAGEVAAGYISHDLPAIAAYTPETIRFLAEFTTASRSPGFQYFRAHCAEADKVMRQKNFAENVIDKVVIKEEIDTAAKPDWSMVRRTITGKYNPVIADRAVTKAQIYHDYGKDWTAFGTALVHYTDTYEDQNDLDLLNRNARMILQHCDNPVILRSALQWSKRATAQAPAGSAYRTTYQLIKQKLKE